MDQLHHVVVGVADLLHSHLIAEIRRTDEDHPAVAPFELDLARVGRRGSVGQQHAPELRGLLYEQDRLVLGEQEARLSPHCWWHLAYPPPGDPMIGNAAMMSRSPDKRPVNSV